MKDIEFVAFDLETTGLSPAFNRIVEFGAVRFRADGTELDRLEQLVDPRCRIPEDAIKVHGITDEMVHGQPTVEEVLPQFMNFIGSSDTILMAHNAPFDLGFLSAALDRLRADIPENPIVDTLELSRWRIYQLPNHRLETVARHLRISNSTDHRALGDALIVGSVFLKLISRPPAVRKMTDLYNFIPPFYFEDFLPEPLMIPSDYEPLVKAIEVCQTISIVYEGGTKGARKRRITPKGLIEERGSLYLIAHCHIDDAEKHFRLDRIVRIEGI